MLIEIIVPRRTLSEPRWYRWLNNLSLVGFNSIVLQLTLPLLALEAAIWAQSQQIGLLHIIELPLWLARLSAFWLWI
ncbi:possible sterol desaturase [Vibrio ishigakensis]|uniref:Possible sterol desaturase n=1 Tax=Vibrio ishigakensis TaxID=1481914 RepID=A0A0B8NQD6_9VIBR|nr:possible sterol desaturase [Vibrio ishigakensis]